MNRSRFRLLVTMSTGLVMIHVVCGAEIGLHPLPSPLLYLHTTYSSLHPLSRIRSGVPESLGSPLGSGVEWWNICPAGRVSNSRLPRDIKGVPVSYNPRSTEIGGKNKDYLPEDLIVLVCTLTAWLLFGRKRILGEQQSIE